MEEEGTTVSMRLPSRGVREGSTSCFSTSSRRVSDAIESSELWKPMERWTSS
jgi:hypothetical protein